MCMHAGSPLQKNALIFGNVFTVTYFTVCCLCLKYYTVLYIYILKNKFNSNISHFIAFVVLNKHNKSNEVTACTMCMHAGSPLQKNAPIFGNVFTVTSLPFYMLI